MTPSPGGASSLAPVPSHGHRVHEDSVPPAKSLELAPRMDKGKQLVEEGFQSKRKWVVSVKSDESVSEEGVMADARRSGREVEFFRINPNADMTGRLVDVTDRCRQLPLRLLLPIQ